ncbi:TPA: hypothetical protein ACH3X3_013949 [Trebouxia sp. C0006]
MRLPNLFGKPRSLEQVAAAIRHAGPAPRQELEVDRFIYERIDLKSTDIPEYQEVRIAKDVQKLCETLPIADRVFVRKRAEYNLKLFKKLRKQKVEVQGGSQVAKLAHLIDTERRANLKTVLKFVTESSNTVGSICCPVECRRQLAMIEDMLVFDKPSDWADLPGADVARASIGSMPLRRDKGTTNLLTRLSSDEGTWDEHRNLGAFAPYVNC